MITEQVFKVVRRNESGQLVSFFDTPASVIYLPNEPVSGIFGPLMAFNSDVRAATFAQVNTRTLSQHWPEVIGQRLEVWSATITRYTKKLHRGRICVSENPSARDIKRFWQGKEVEAKIYMQLPFPSGTVLCESVQLDERKLSYPILAVQPYGQREEQV